MHAPQGWDRIPSKVEIDMGKRCRHSAESSGRLSSLVRLSTLLPALCLGLLACAPSLAADLPSDVPVPRDLKLPVDAPVAVYLPESMRDMHSVFQGAGGVQSGQNFAEQVIENAGIFFGAPHLVDQDEDKAYSLVLALHPDAKFDNGTLTYTLRYKVYDPGGNAVLSGEKSSSVGFGPFSATGGDVIGKVTQKALLLGFADIVSQLRPTAGKFPPTGNLRGQPLDFLANREKPTGTGTGFYFNAAGQLLTAAHVVRHCISIESSQDDKARVATVVAHSDLLDIAVLDTHAPAPVYLKFRRDEGYELGETVTAVGYPLQPVLSAKPTLTRGNISSQSGLVGSVGQLQFSAPIQPGSSGGPIVSEAGEVLGFAVATLGTSGVQAPTQNVNFALEARYAAQFLRRQHIAFEEVDAGGKADLHTATTAALGAVVSVKCYE